MLFLESFVGHITLMSVIIYFTIAFVVWYIGYGLEMYLNGGSLGRGRWWVFKCFVEEAQWFLPGGLEKRTNYIRTMVGTDRSLNGFVGGHSYEEIRTHNLYEKIAKRSLGNGFTFWGVDVILLFFLWPVAVAILALLVVVSNVFDFCAHVYYSVVRPQKA